MKKFISKALIVLMIMSIFGTTTALAATGDNYQDTMASGGGYVVFEGVGRERQAITNPVTTRPVSWNFPQGLQRGDWRHGVTSTHIVSETISYTGQGRASITPGLTGRILDGGWRPTNFWSSAPPHTRSPHGYTDRANWDLRP